MKTTSLLPLLWETQLRIENVLNGLILLFLQMGISKSNDMEQD